MRSMSETAYEFVTRNRWFHGTGLENAMKILKEGFKITEDTGEAALGFGVYFTNDIERARHYAERNEKPAIIEIELPDECFVTREVSDLTGTFGTLEQHAKNDLEFFDRDYTFDEIIEDDQIQQIYIDRYGSLDEARKKFDDEGWSLLELEDVMNLDYTINGYKMFIDERTWELVDEGVQVGVRGSQMVVYDKKLLKKIKARITGTGQFKT